jgi:hypothetical protein
MKFVNVALTKLLCLGLFLSSCNTHAQVHSVSVAAKSRRHQSNTISTQQFRLLTEGNQFFLSLHPGLIGSGITKERDWEGECFHALMNHFVIGDADGDGLMDIGIVKEEIQCPSEDDDWFGARLQHAMGWYLFLADGGKPAETGDPERFLELPLIGMTSSPVEFGAVINWHSYDPAKWYYPPVFTPSYRQRLIENEVQTRRKQQTYHGLMPKVEHPPNRVPDQESP